MALILTVMVKMFLILQYVQYVLSRTVMRRKCEEELTCKLPDARKFGKYIRKLGAY